MTPEETMYERITVKMSSTYENMFYSELSVDKLAAVLEEMEKDITLLKSKLNK